LVWWLAITPARGGTRILLAAEGITVLLIVIVIVIVFAKLAGHSAPNGLGVDWAVFSLPSGVPLSTIFLGVVFGFLSFAGFEAASTLGEETRRPRRDIPRAILGVAIFGGHLLRRGHRGRGDGLRPPQPRASPRSSTPPR